MKHRNYWACLLLIFCFDYQASSYNLWIFVKINQCKFILGVNLTEKGQKSFLAWQTFDLLRLMYHGFTEFCDDFLRRFPSYFVSPLRINGSALETIFSQLRANSNNYLTSTNYEYSLRNITLRKRLPATQDGYRNEKLYTFFFL